MLDVTLIPIRIYIDILYIGYKSLEAVSVNFIYY